MFRFTVLAFLLLCRTPLAQSENAEVVCQDLLEEYTICLLNAPDNEVSSDDYYIDEAACSECFFKYNFFEAYDATNCDDATTEICTFFNKCLQECSPKNTVCSEEVTAYYTCAFGSTYAPENCMVTCDGMVGGADSGSDDSTISSGDGEGGGNNGGDNDVDEQKDSTSAGSTVNTVLSMTASASTLLVVAGLLL